MANGQLLTTTDDPARESDSTSGDVVLELDNVAKQFGTEDVISGLSLSVRDGEILTLLGPSGCGKTTTLRLIAGLERPSAGHIRLDDSAVAGEGRFVPPEERGVGVVFQEFALFPHLTARENVAFGLQKWTDEQRDARVEELLELVGLESHGEHYPEELSGGQQQRIALARSLAPEPEMLLLDEPFSNLDVDLRVEMREEVRRIIKEAGVTAISVTHDQEEALSISDRVAVMYDGTLEQVDTPERVFQDPKSRFVAGFLGHASFLSGSVHGDHVDTALGRVLRDDVNGLAHQYDGTDIDLLVRPDDVTAYPSNAAEANGRVVYRRYLGPTVLYRVELDSGETIECMHNHSDRIDLDERVAVRVTADHELAWFPVGQRDGETQVAAD
ncbi:MULTISPECIES: ABC transporter ATP-binding protein [Natrialba]|uniref:Molybdate/tungstate import ATP-binding protein WtpC n=1 Tax=Natrialba swarupiae TaxID=2448032 RepID=A0A5D5ANY2_9EURY|nr:MULTISPECIES: ABC transporter ATP-binding protein [Natrialba]MWV39374.1 ATP-binding cassette domain-containing protein [Natrialba sp. INN-245]TYT63396.1 ABC transporter ATP-binding protein [Natrialba swarupiae]